MAKYPDFIKSTGYGTGEGLCGWNCRHSFHPYFPGIDTPSYTEEELQNIDPPPVEYNGKKLDYYQQTQKQRSMETAMRKTKREIIAAKAAGDDDMFTAKSVLLRRQREEYDKFSKATGLLTQKERTQVYGFDKSISAKAAWAAKKAQNRLDKSGGSGIINIGQTKLNKNGTISNPMDPKRYNRMKESLERNGCPVIAAHGEDKRFLIAFGAEAISDEHGIMHLGDVPSASAFFEEIIHNTQTKKYGVANYDSDGIERAAREIAANRKMLKHGKEYGFTNEDFEEIHRNLKLWEKSFERKVGVPYDEADFKRDI